MGEKKNEVEGGDYKCIGSELKQKSKDEILKMFVYHELIVCFVVNNMHHVISGLLIGDKRGGIISKKKFFFLPHRPPRHRQQEEKGKKKCFFSELITFFSKMALKPRPHH